MIGNSSFVFLFFVSLLYAFFALIFSQITSYRSFCTWIYT